MCIVKRKKKKNQKLKINYKLNHIPLFKNTINVFLSVHILAVYA